METIIVYGLNEKERGIIEGCGLKCEVIGTNIYQDVIAQYANLTIINPFALEETEKASLLEFYQEIDPVDEKVILTSLDEGFSNLSFVEMIPDLFDDPERVSVVLMKYMKETKRDIDFSRRIMLAIKILHLISQNPGISSKELADNTEISVRSVRRYIRSIQAAGILLEFRNKGWYCLVDPRELL